MEKTNSKVNISYHLKELIAKAVLESFDNLNLTAEAVSIEHPTVEDYGDYSSNVALVLSKQIGGNPRKIAEKIVAALEQNRSDSASNNIIEKISIAGAGFINFELKEEFLKNQIKQISELGEKFGNGDWGEGQKIAIEIVSPNINKPLHIGHLRNAALGMSLSELYKASGWQVVRDEINNDRGLHIMKAAYGYLIFGRKEKSSEYSWKKLLDNWISDTSSNKNYSIPGLEKGDEFVGKFYVLGEKFLEENKDIAEPQLTSMLQAWEDEDKDVWALWETMSEWVHSGIDQTYKRIGVLHDKKWYEHELYKEGRDYVLEAVKEGKFEKLSDGAIQANLESYKLPNKILIRNDGTSIYVTFDIALTKHKVEEFKADKYVWVVGSDQVDHFKRLFAIFEILGFGKVDNFYHLAYGMVRMPGGKMSSRLGNVILADDLIDKMVESAGKLMMDRKIGMDYSDEEKAKIKEAVGVGALKYAMLKVSPLLDITFDLDKSVSLEGDSGPYLQYTYARAKSVVRKASETNNSGDKLEDSLSPEERALLRWIYRFPEVVELASKNYAPNLIATYLFDLAKRFNNFYNNQQIVGSKSRLDLTKATSVVLKNGLTLLGIEALERM